MLDRFGESFSFYNDVPTILSAARERGITMSLASRTHAPDLANDMLRGLHVPATTSTTADDNGKHLRALDFFTHAQIYPGTKTTHFRRIHAATAKPKAGGGGRGAAVPFEDMLFFDDEGRNRNVETELGVTFWLVRDGVTTDEVDRGVWEWRKRRGIGRKDLPGEKVAELE
jgi:magnesium-dependent phosphatase 1